MISTLSIGDKPINLSASRPEVYVVVPGDPFQAGEKVRTRDLPVGSMTMRQAFPKVRLVSGSYPNIVSSNNGWQCWLFESSVLAEI